MTPEPGTSRAFQAFRKERGRGRDSLRSLLACVVVGTAVALPLQGCGAQELQDLSGREMFLRYCSACHGEEGRGDGAVGTLLRPRPPDLTALAAAGRFDEERIAEVIDGRRMPRAHGTRQMPVWGAIFEEQLDDEKRPDPPFEAYLRTIVLVDYLRSIQTPPDP